MKSFKQLKLEFQRPVYMFTYTSKPELTTICLKRQSCEQWLPTHTHSLISQTNQSLNKNRLCINRVLSPTLRPS